LVGGPCEGCEAIFEYGDKQLTAVDTLPSFYEDGTKLKVTGTIYRQNGKPAKDIILYIYHTNADGIYPTKGGETGWAKRHGYLRGWIKTGSDGVYTFYTSKPGSYPERSAPAHIHPTILEPDGKYYWLDEYQFKDDPLIAKTNIPSSPRGGTPNVVALQQEGNMLVARRDIVLGKNIAGY
jgi:protocatechuate 3,4-dioxygenase beta subunit